MLVIAVGLTNAGVSSQSLETLLGGKGAVRSNESIFPGKPQPLHLSA